MAHAAQLMCGERDFTSFRASGCSARTTVRYVQEVRVRRTRVDVICIDVLGNAFLRNMVRIIAGTLVAVGVGRFAAEDITGILDARDRTRAGQTAPACGLTLMKVFYEPESLHLPEDGPTPLG